VGENQKLPTNTQLLGSLARELKNPLILIARQAELEAMNTSDRAFDSIRNTAEQTMKLIDCYLLIAQSEYGQTKLPLETIGVGSVIYDALEEFRPLALRQRVSLVSDVHDVTVETNAKGFKTALWCLLNMALESVISDEKCQKQITICARKQPENNVSVSVLGNMEVSQKEMSLARKLQGSSHLAMGLHSKSSGVHLAIAELFANAAGDGLHVARQGNSRGLSLKLMKSQQLQLI
jgi:K+-sensing histidine kinase KdpD